MTVAAQEETVMAGEAAWDPNEGEGGADNFEDDVDEEIDDGQGAPGTGPYETLAVQGPRSSEGSTGHPEECLPCTFYCFTRRGCNRGTDCRFCHLVHQSKLQLRRESWKKQQRDKRKAIRERMATEAAPRRLPAGPGNGQGAPPLLPQGGAARGTEGARAAAARAGKSLQGAGRAELGPDSGRPNCDHAMFCYSLDEQIYTVGQDVELTPQVMMDVSAFRLTTPLPPGLALDRTSGAIHGTATAAAPASTVVVEADVQGGGAMRATIDMEVIDFTRGGYVMGHMSEVEKGRFMMLLYTPDADEKIGGAEGPYLPLGYAMPGYSVDCVAAPPILPGFCGVDLSSAAQKAFPGASGDQPQARASRAAAAPTSPRA
ncbi:unnamed protein product, partial [Prorocentrum cordatum]